MIHLAPILAAVAGSLLLGGRASRGHGLGGRSSSIRAGRGLFDLMGSCYGNDTERFKEWSSRQPTADPAWKTMVHEKINKGAWYDLKPEETAATTSKLGPGIIEINMDAGKTPPLPNLPDQPAAPMEAQPDEELSGAIASPFEFLEVPDENIESSFNLKCLRIISAAAHADGVIVDTERKLIEGRLGDLSPEEAELSRQELDHPQSIESICQGINTLEDKKFIFGLAVITLRADGKITTDENLFVRNLARELKLDKSTAMEIIKTARPGA